MEPVRSVRRTGSENRAALRSAAERRGRTDKCTRPLSAAASLQGLAVLAEKGDRRIEAERLGWRALLRAPLRVCAQRGGEQQRSHLLDALGPLCVDERGAESGVHVSAIESYPYSREAVKAREKNWDGSTADKVARRATYPTLEHDNYDPASSQSASGATSARGAAVRPLLRRLSSDQDSCGSGSTTSEANDIFDTLDDHLGF